MRGQEVQSGVEARIVHTYESELAAEATDERVTWDVDEHLPRLNRR
jgi:hypothetical protein